MIAGIVAGAQNAPSSTHPLTPLFAGGEFGDLWRFDQAHTDAAGTASDPFGVAYGLINGLQLTQGTAGLKPKVRVTDGIEVGYFDGGDLLQLIFGVDVPQPGTIIIALDSTDVSTHIIYTSQLASTKRWQLSNNSSDNVELFAGTSLTGIRSPLGKAVITGVFDGASSKQRRGRGTRRTGNAGTQVTDSLFVGGYASNPSFTGDVVGILFIDRVLTDTEIKDAENWFLAEMNLMQGGLGAVDAPLPDLALAFWNLFPDSYTGNCLKVERMSDNSTQDIGFDVNGDLDTAAIASFCGASDGRLHTWYNQRNGASGLVGGDGTSATRPRIYVGATGLMVVDANGKIAFDKGTPSANRPTLQGAAAGPEGFTLLCSYQTSDTIITVLGENSDSGEYLGIAEASSSSTTMNNDSGTVRTGTYYDDGSPITIANRGAAATAFCDNTPHRYGITVPGYTPGSLPTLGWYPAAATTFRMASGFFSGYVLTYGTALTSTEIAAVDTYLAANMP